MAMKKRSKEEVSPRKEKNILTAKGNPLTGGSIYSQWYQWSIFIFTLETLVMLEYTIQEEEINIIP